MDIQKTLDIPPVLPEKNRIKSIYDSYSNLFNIILINIEQGLKDNLVLASSPTFKSRVKSFSSYYRKILRVKKMSELKADSLICITDMIGIRVICAFLEDLDVVEQQIKEKYNVKEIEHKGQANNFREFGYESVHILIEIPPDCLPDQPLNPAEKTLPLPPDLVCEIQIRTILQDAWAEVEHELVYKSEFSPFDMPLRRKLASMNASLSLADIIFQEIRDYQKKFQKEVDDRRFSFYEQADNLTRSSAPELVSVRRGEKIQRISPYVHGTIDDMLLEAIHAHNTGDLDKAIQIYTVIIESDPVPPVAVLTVIYKHRGMAYFAKNEFTKALADFQKTITYDAGNFRALYYEGIVYSVMNSYREAIECFTKSLEINEFQSHAHYRRALAHYKLNEYTEALEDLGDAAKLGLDDEDCQALHKKLIEKFDMKM